MLLNITRRFHANMKLWALETSLLAKLRKKTGYTIANCKKALELNENDLLKAESWLQAKAQEMGWSKASKLAGRVTAQGLVAVRFDKSQGALVEINCETDFVAKNEKFSALIEEAANACFNFANTYQRSGEPISKIFFDSEKLGMILTSDGKSLKDKLALMIGSVGENAVLKRAECWKANSDDIILTGYAHPNLTNSVSDYQSGKYSALLAFKVGDIQNEVIGRELCQHIVGMNPTKIGNAENDEPAENADDEQCLIYQEYLLDPDISVREVLEENNIEVVDYVRFECGQEEQGNDVVYKQQLDNVKTCQ